MKWNGGLSALLLFLAVACKGRDAHVVLMYDAAKGAPEIETIETIVGEDIAKAPNLHPGDRFELDYRANRAAPTWVVNYTLDGQRYAWAGPRIPVGSRYDIEVRLDADGYASSRHCIRPCRVDAEKWSAWAAVAHW
jgi:hypothetical protein